MFEIGFADFERGTQRDRFRALEDTWPGLIDRTFPIRFLPKQAGAPVGTVREYECQFQLGYKGLLDLAYRSGEISVIQAHVVYSEDQFSYSFGLKPELKHIPASGERGEPVYVYAIFHTKDGGYGFEVCSIDDIRAHAQRYSKSFQNGPWQTNFEEMAKKTVLKRVLKYAPLKSEFLRELAQDETIKQEISEDMYMVEAAYAEPDVSSAEND